MGPRATGAVREIEDQRAVVAALSDLPLRQRQSVVLRDWARFETEEVARMIGAKASTVRVHRPRTGGPPQATDDRGRNDERRS